MRRRRRNLLRSPQCYWCGRDVRYWRLKPHETMPPDFATLDHVNQKYEQTPRPIPGKLVLACNECNMARARELEKQMPIEVLWERSKRHKRDAA